MRDEPILNWMAAVPVLALALAGASLGDEMDIPYGQADGKILALDLYHPEGESGKRPAPLVVWVHGGAWRSGSKSNVPIKRLVREGYAIASVEYRLSTAARFPAQAQDIKTAIRFLRAKADEFRIDPDRIAVAGDSAGGHLAALVGVTDGIEELDGSGNAGTSAAVQAIVSYYGASNLRTILSQSTPHGLEVRIPALKLLLGALPEEAPELAALASPVVHVDAHDPPLLLLHGDQDNQMPINQAHELAAAYERLKLPVRFEVIDGAGHGDRKFYDETRMAVLKEFLDKYLKRGKRGAGEESAN